MAMNMPSFELTLIPLVPSVNLPGVASARTRSEIPSGRGVQEECLPFTAANALGLLIPSPIEFGLCMPEDVPPGCRAFRSPLNRAGSDGQYADPKVFFVFDRPDCRFIGNAYEFEDIPGTGSQPVVLREPGISFFDREDQHDVFKLHLPYIWRTPESIDTLFLPLLNRPGNRPEALSGQGTRSPAGTRRPAAAERRMLRQRRLPLPPTRRCSPSGRSTLTRWPTTATEIQAERHLRERGGWWTIRA